MILIPNIEVDGFYTKQLFRPTTRDECKYLIDDFKFMCKNVGCDPDFVKYFPTLSEKIRALDETTVMDFLENKLIASNVFLSIRRTDGDQVLGFIKLCPDPISCNFLEFYIDERYRRKGVMKNILTIFIENLKSQTLKVSANVDSTNDISRHLLENLGFETKRPDNKIIYYCLQFQL